MESEKRLKAKISVLEYLTKNKTLYDKDGIELAGSFVRAHATTCYAIN